MQVNKVNWFSVVVPSTKALVIYMPQNKNKQTLKDTFWVAEDLMWIQTVKRGKTYLLNGPEIPVSTWTFFLLDLTRFQKQGPCVAVQFPP